MTMNWFLFRWNLGKLETSHEDQSRDLVAKLPFANSSLGFFLRCSSLGRHAWEPGSQAGKKRQGIEQQLFLMCGEATYVICREHIASRKIIKNVCECGRNTAVKTGCGTMGTFLCCLNCVASGHAVSWLGCLFDRGSLHSNIAIPVTPNKVSLFTCGYSYLTSSPRVSSRSLLELWCNLKVNGSPHRVPYY